MPFWGVLVTSEIGLLAQPKWSKIYGQEIPEFSSLQRQFSKVGDGRGQDDASTYSQAINDLSRTAIEIMLLSNSRPDMVLIMNWPVKVSKKFINLLQLQKPEAMIILAFYAGLLHSRNDLWWLEGWGACLVVSIDRRLDERWKGWLAWPKKACNI
jgi:hypothetical protein